MGNKKYKKRRTKLIWIFCEGKSEENYFKQLIAFERLKKVNIKNPKKTDPLGIVNEAIFFKKNGKILEGDEIFCVFDTGNINADLLKKVIQLSKKNKIKLITSYPCFEYWILCHFEKYSQPGGPAEIISRLKKSFKGYKKGDPELYNLTKGRIDEAIRNVKSTLKNSKKKNKKSQYPSTQIHELIRYLRSLRSFS